MGEMGTLREALKVLQLLEEREPLIKKIA